MSKLQVVREIHRDARKHFPRRKYIMYGIADTLQVDLIEMQPFKRENRGYRYILIAIDVFSKMAYAEPLLNKTAVETTHAMERILKKIRPRQIQSDNGVEFFNKSMDNLFKKHKINHYASYSILKASIVERLIRTIKRRLYMQFSLQGNYRWLGILQKIIDEYNNTR